MIKCSSNPIYYENQFNIFVRAFVMINEMNVGKDMTQEVFRRRKKVFNMRGM